MMLARARLPEFRNVTLDLQLPEEYLLNVDQAALYLAVSASTLNHWRSDGKGPRFIKLCGSTRGSIRYRVADLRAYVERNTFSSVAEAELSHAMSRVGQFWDEWSKPHPFITRGPHFLIDSAVADREIFFATMHDPYARIRWVKPVEALKRPWCRPERRAELLAVYLKDQQNGLSRAVIDAAYMKNLGAIPEQYWGSHPDLTLQALIESAWENYPIEYGP